LRSGESGRFLADAAKAAQMVWGLVEPQPSGIGGGAFVVHHNATAKKVQTCDKRETAPAAATENKQRWVGATDQTTPLPWGTNAFNQTRRSQRSIGRLGLAQVLQVLHGEPGSQPWARLSGPGLKLATNRFPIWRAHGRRDRRCASPSAASTRHGGLFPER